MSKPEMFDPCLLYIFSSRARYRLLLVLVQFEDRIITEIGFVEYQTWCTCIKNKTPVCSISPALY